MPYQKVMDDKDESTANKVKNYVTNLYNQGKALIAPEDSEAEAFKAKESQINQVAPQPAAQSTRQPIVEKYPVDMITPPHKYGERPGEKVIDTKPMMKPLGQGLPLYDEGGEVTEDKNNVNDGKHQMAVLEDGERVLTPEETEQYDREHGSADEPRMVAESTPPPKPSMEPIVPRETPAEPKPYPGAQPPQPSAQASTYQMPADQMKVQPQESPEPVNVFQKQKEDAAKKGDLVGLGAAIIGEKATARPQDTAPTTPTTPTGDAEIKDPKQAFKNKIAQYKQAYQQALDEFTPEGQKRAASIKEAMLNYMRENPYGSAGNHPGILGKIEHGLATVGNVAGAVLAPGVEAMIPGSALNRMEQSRAARSMGEAASKEELEGAEAAKANAFAKMGGAPGAYEIKEITHPDGTTELVRVNKVTNQAEPTAGTAGSKVIDPVKQAKQKIEAAQKAGDMAAVEQAQAELAQLDPKAANEYLHSQVVGKLSEKGLINSANISDPKAVKQAIDQGLKNNVITPREVAGYNAWASEHPDTAQQMLMTAVKGDEAVDRAIKKMYEGKTVQVETAPNQYEQMSSAEALAKGYTYDQMLLQQPGQAQKNEETVANAIDTKRAIVKYHDDYNKYAKDLTADDIRAFQTLQRNEGRVASALSGIIGDIPALGPISEAVNKRIQGYMMQQGYDSLSKGGKALMADYFNAIVANFADTKRRLGGIGRNDSMILAEMHTIPMGGIDVASANEAFKDKLQSIDDRNKFLPRVKGQHPSDIKPTKEAEEKADIPTVQNHKYRVEPKGKPPIYSNDGKTWYDAKGKQIGAKTKTETEKE